MNSIYGVLDFLNKDTKEAILSNVNEINSITEIRIRRAKPLIIYLNDKPSFISGKGLFVDSFNEDCLIISQNDFNDIVNKLCNSSFHTNVETMKRGYVITKSGVRIGVSLKAVYQKGELVSVKDISSLNIRIPHEHRNCSLEIINKLYDTSMPNIIVAAPPSMGKTTFLRDCTRIISSGYKNNYHKVAVIDERCEISADFDIGINTDVLCNFPKSVGIEMAIRTLSPDIIVCDEIGTTEELEKISFGFSSGVGFIVSVHTSGGEGIGYGSIPEKLISIGFFDYLIKLEHYTEKYKIINLKEDKIEACRYSGNYNCDNICRNISNNL